MAFTVHNKRCGQISVFSSDVGRVSQDVSDDVRTEPVLKALTDDMTYKEAWPLILYFCSVLA